MDQLKKKMRMNKLILCIFFTLISMSGTRASELVEVESRLVNDVLSVRVWNVSKKIILIKLEGGMQPVLYVKNQDGFLPLVPSVFTGKAHKWSELWPSPPKARNSITSSFQFNTELNEEMKRAYLIGKLYVSIEMLTGNENGQIFTKTSWKVKIKKKGQK